MSRATIGVASSANADRLRDRDNAAGIATTLQRSAITPQKSAMAPRDRRYGREHDSMQNSILNGDWSNSVPGRKIPEGFVDAITELITEK